MKGTVITHSKLINENQFNIFFDVLGFREGLILIKKTLVKKMLHPSGFKIICILILFIGRLKL